MSEETIPSARSLGATIDAVCVRLAETMDALNRLVEDEAALVRDGRVFGSGSLKATESALLDLYRADLRWLEARMDLIRQLNPDIVEWLRQRHAAFRALMRINLAALATAREVSELRLQEVADRLRAKPARTPDDTLRAA